MYSDSDDWLFHRLLFLDTLYYRVMGYSFSSFPPILYSLVLRDHRSRLKTH